MAADPRELDDLQSAAREVLADLASSAAVHDLVDSDRVRDGALDTQLTELGFYSVLLPGTDGTLEHLARIVIEAGAATATTRLLGHAVGMATALAHVPASATRDAVIARITEGALGGVVGLDGTSLRHTADGDRWLLDGTVDLALDVDGAAIALVWSTGDDGPRLWALDVDHLTAELRPTIDRTRVLTRVTARAVTTTDTDLLAAGPEADRVRRTVGTALDMALAFDSLGVARRARDLTVDYVRTREQFGRPVGSFQAVQHQAADMAVRTELATSICGAALRELVDGAPDATATAAMARDVACRGASWVAGRAIQLHGGIGYTWEHDAHLLLKRAKLNEALAMSARDRRTVVLDALRTTGVPS